MQGGADRYAAGVGVFDDRNGRRSKLSDQLEGGVGVAIIVVGQLLALELPRCRDPGTRVASAVERCRLVRVFTIAQPICQVPGKHEDIGKGHRFITAHPFGYRGVIGRSQCEGLVCEAAPHF